MASEVGGRQEVTGPDGACVLALSDKVLREIIADHGPVAAKFLLFVARGLSDKLIERAQFLKNLFNP